MIMRLLFQWNKSLKLTYKIISTHDVVNQNLIE